MGIIQLEHGITSYEYKQYLEFVNDLITLNEADKLEQLYFHIEKYSLLTPIEEKYILQKIEIALHNFHNSLCCGYIFVWNLPKYQRNYKAYLWTERYIKYVLKHGKLQLQTIYKLEKFILHDNSIGINMSEYRRADILHEIGILLDNYTHSEVDNCHLLSIK